MYLQPAGGQIEGVELVTGYRSLSESRYVNIEDKQAFIEYIISRLPYFSDSYQQYPID